MTSYQWEKKANTTVKKIISNISGMVPAKFCAILGIFVFNWLLQSFVDLGLP
jgi:hypothetical protein